MKRIRRRRLFRCFNWYVWKVETGIIRLSICGELVQGWYQPANVSRWHWLGDSTYDVDRLFCSSEREEYWMQFVRRILCNGEATYSPSQDDACDLRKWWPAIHEHLTLGAWPDGKPRQTSTILVFVEDGVFKACLTDREAEATCWVAARSWAGSMEALENAIKEESTTWRPKKPWKKR